MALEDRDIERLKDIFVTRADCDTITDGINRELSERKTGQAVIEQQLRTINWVVKTTLAAVVTGIVGALLALIIR